MSISSDIVKLKSLYYEIKSSIDKTFNTFDDDIESKSLENYVLSDIKKPKTLFFTKYFNKIIFDKKQFEVRTSFGELFVHRIDNTITNLNELDSYGFDVIKNMFDEVVTRQVVDSALRKILFTEPFEKNHDYTEFFKSLIKELKINDDDFNFVALEQTLDDILTKDKKKNYIFHDGYPHGKCWIEAVK